MEENKKQKKERKEKNEKVKKNRKLKVLDIITLSVIAILLIMYAPRAWSLYEERRAALEEAKKPPVIEYPLEVEITEQDTKFFVEFFKDYGVGIRAEINLLDGITQNEMVDFCRALLSEKYSSSGVISHSAMNSAVKKYFDVSDLNYAGLGYKSLGVYKETEAQKVFNVTKLMQLEENGDLYLVYTDCIDKANVQEGTYKKENIEDVYIFTFKKIVTEEETELGVVSNVKYIIQKVEKEVIEEPAPEETTKEDNKVKDKK